MRSVIPHPVSAGGFVFRQPADQLEVLVALQGGRWRVPKGMQEPDEPLVLTAIREVREETGVVAATVARLEPIGWTYVYEGVPCDETCHMFLMVDTGQPILPHDDETEAIAWVAAGDLVGRLHFDSEAKAAREALDVVAHTEPFAPRLLSRGRAAGAGTASGRLSLTREDAEARLDGGDDDVILVLEQFVPSDAVLLTGCRGVVSLVGGPTSHIAVVAAAVGIPCVTAPSGVRHYPQAWVGGDDLGVPPGSQLHLTAIDGGIWFAPATAANHDVEPRFVDETDQLAAYQWARARARELELPAPLNWKLFKRDLLTVFCPTPPTKRFLSPWHANDVVAYARTLRGGAVRCSAFPSDIACHAVSVVLPAEKPSEWCQIVSDLDPNADLEIFIEQSRDQLCWRLIRTHAERVVEAGHGQAMYVFESERGVHETVSARWRPESASEVMIEKLDTALGQRLARFLSICRVPIDHMLDAISSTLGVEVFAVEGYYRDETLEFVVCDIDLPMDRAFMA